MVKLMQVLEKNIKGFNLLEVLIVIVIIGFVSAVAYPNLSSWSKERKATDHLRISFRTKEFQKWLWKAYN